MSGAPCPYRIEDPIADIRGSFQPPQLGPILRFSLGRTESSRALTSLEWSRCDITPHICDWPLRSPLAAVIMPVSRSAIDGGAACT
jgi:hypothetical protein